MGRAVPKALLLAKEHRQACRAGRGGSRLAARGAASAGHALLHLGLGWLAAAAAGHWQDAERHLLMQSGESQTRAHDAVQGRAAGPHASSRAEKQTVNSNKQGTCCEHCMHSWQAMALRLGPEASTRALQHPPARRAQSRVALGTPAPGPGQPPLLLCHRRAPTPSMAVRRLLMALYEGHSIMGISLTNSTYSMGTLGISRVAATAQIRRPAVWW